MSHRIVVTRGCFLMLLLVALIGASASPAWAQLGLHSGPLGAGGGDAVEPGLPGPGAAVTDQPAAALDPAAIVGPTAEQLRAVRAASFLRIDAALGIDSHKLLQERLIAVGATGQLAVPADAGSAGQTTRGGVIRKILTSDKLPMLLGLLPIGSKLDLIKGVIAIVGKVVAGGAESAVPGALTEEEIAYMMEHPDDIRRALELEQRRTAPEQEAVASEAAAAQSAIDRLIELEDLRREQHAAEQASREAADEVKRRNERIRELEQEAR